MKADLSYFRASNDSSGRSYSIHTKSDGAIVGNIRQNAAGQWEIEDKDGHPYEKIPGFAGPDDAALCCICAAGNTSRPLKCRSA